MALQCVPFVMPDHWAGVGICKDLPGYTIHSEPAMRQVATTVLKRCMKALPGLRDVLVGSMATFAVRLPEDHADVIHDSLGLLLSLMHEWMALAVEEAAFPQSAESPRPAPPAFGSLHRVEGAALGLLCASDLETRRQALKVLRSARELHQALTQPAPSNRRSTMNADFFGRQASIGGVEAQSRRPTQQHTASESMPSTPGVGDCMGFVADIIDRWGDRGQRGTLQSAGCVAAGCHVTSRDGPTGLVKGQLFFQLLPARLACHHQSPPHPHLAPSCACTLPLSHPGAAW